MKEHPTKEELVHLYSQEKRTWKEVSELCNLSMSTVRSIARSYGISNVPYYIRKYPDLPESLTQKQNYIVAGSLLGDGSINSRPNRRFGYFTVMQERSRHSYIRWLHNRFIPFSTGGVKFYTSGVDARTGKVYHSVHFRTIAHPEFNKWRILFYPNGKKIVPENIADLINPLSLAVWYIEDGCFNTSNGKQECTLSTQAFTPDECEILKSMLVAKFGIPTSIHKRDEYKILYVRREPWIATVGPFVWRVACMRRKLPKGYFPTSWNSSQNSTSDTSETK